MKIVLASSNKGKIKEIKEIMSDYEVVSFCDLLGQVEIVEDGDSFKTNAVIKAKTIYEKLNDKNAIVVSDDSGISVDELDGNPGIYSARYAGSGASDEDNLNKIIDELKKRDISSSYAHYTCAVAIASRYGVDTVHGWMHGRVQDYASGDGGFGYDPIFIPQNHTKTLGNLAPEIKKKLSHRTKAFELAKTIIEGIN